MSKIYDTQKVEEIFEKVIIELPDEQKEQLRAEFNKEIESHFNFIRVSHDLRQKTQYHTAGMILETDERKTWWLYETLLPLIVHEEIILQLKERYGNNYIILIKRLLNIKSKINKVKYYLDQKDKVSVNSKEFIYYDRLYLESIDKLELIDYDLWDVLIFLSEVSNIGSYSIPDSIINTMQKQIKKPIS